MSFGGALSSLGTFPWLVEHGIIAGLRLFIFIIAWLPDATFYRLIHLARLNCLECQLFLPMLWIVPSRGEPLEFFRYDWIHHLCVGEVTSSNGLCVFSDFIGDPLETLRRTAM